MSIHEIVLCTAMLSCAGLVVCLAVKVALRDMAETRENSKWWDRYYARKEADEAEEARIAKLDKTIWGAQVPPPEKESPT